MHRHRSPSAGLLSAALFLALLGAPLGWGCAKAPGEPGDRDILGAVSPDVVDSRFGVVVETDQGEAFVSTRYVMLVPGTKFIWGVRLADSDRTVAWREEYRLPSAPAEVAGARQSSPDLVRREGRDPLDDGWLAKSWTLTAGDPMGRHVIDVFIDGALAHTFEFDVLPPPPPGATAPGLPATQLP